MHNFPEGTYDFHLHPAPDIVARRFDDDEIAQRLIAAKMKGCVIKAHHGDTSARAKLMEKRYPCLHIGGGVTLNHAVGGLNPRAVEVCALTGGKIVWFPTMDSRAYQAFHMAKHPDMDLGKLIPILDDKGALLPAAVEVLKMAAKCHMIVATGHISAEEGMAIIREGAKHGCQMLVTHADLPSNRYTTEQLQEAVVLGAMVEYCYFTLHYDRTPAEMIAEQIRAIGCEHFILSTDFGQVKSPYPDEGMAMFAEAMRQQGFSDEELLQMMCKNPERLMGWN